MSAGHPQQPVYFSLYPIEYTSPTSDRLVRNHQSTPAIPPPIMNISRPVPQSEMLPDRPRRKPSPMAGYTLAMAGEFVGTFLFLFFGYGGNVVAATQAATVFVDGSPTSQTVMFIALTYAFPLMVNIWGQFNTSGGHLNPAVTLAVCLTGECSWLRAPFMWAGQIFGAIMAGVMVEALLPAGVSKANTTIGTGASTAQAFFIELIITTQLIFTALSLSDTGERAIFIVPVGVGMSLIGIILTTGSFTGASANPARSLGCAIASRSFPDYYWIYWLAPVLAAGLAVGVFKTGKLLKRMETVREVEDYEMTSAPIQPKNLVRTNVV